MHEHKRYNSHNTMLHVVSDVLVCSIILLTTEENRWMHSAKLPSWPTAEIFWHG
jgi:hypothetical protein